jgi:hypothetical protein
LAGSWAKGFSEFTLVINEFMAENDGFVEDPYGDEDDWIEIYNYGDEAIDIGGMYLTDDLLDHNDFYQIPDNDPEQTTIGSHEFLLIWADGEPQEGTLHIGFKLEKNGEDIGLYESDKITRIDAIDDFPVQYSDESYGHFPDGNDNWLVLLNPTPGSANMLEPIGIFINEIMYHPYHSTVDPVGPENIGEEYIELINTGSQLVSFEGWRFSNGIDFAFPNDVTIDSGQYLVVAADVNTFKVKYPTVTNVIGGWSGRLSNSGEEIELVDESGIRIDRVRYADQGEWAVRELGPLDIGHRGWIWSEEHDGDGKSLELINPVVSNKHGQNWAASLNNGGTPGTTNLRASSNIPPIILRVEHRPRIPGPNDPVTVTADIVDELKTGILVMLFYRVDGGPSFIPLPMYDDGAHGDDEADDGEWGGQIPAMPDGTIIEFYVQARDSFFYFRTWPAPADVDGTPQQVTNALYQVDATFDPNADWIPGSQPIYYLIMTEADRAELEDIVNDSTLEGPDSQMNATFISVDGVDVKTRYLVGVRNRGHGTRDNWPNNYRVNFAHDRPWKDVTAINLNIVYTWLQLAGNAILQMSGVAQCEPTAVQVRTNGVNLAILGGGETYGSYAHIEVIDTDFVDNHYPDDDAGNTYKGMRITHEADLRYEGLDPDSYRENYFKSSNTAEDDWSDLIELTYALSDNTPDESYTEEVNRVLDAEQWLRFIAINALMDNRETTLANGNGDDYYLYRGIEDTRFVLIQHDLDSVFGLGQNSGSITDGIFEATDIPAMKRFLEHPQFAPRYYWHLKDLIETTFSAEHLGAFLDNLLAGFVPTTRINQMKDFVAQRNAYILSIIPSELTIGTSLPQSYGYYWTTNPSVDISGEADAINTRSILVNGMQVAYSPVNGAWNTGTGLPGDLLLFLPMDTVWSYEQSDIDLGTAWRDPNYDPCAPGDGSSWSSGKGLFYVEGAALPGPKNTPLTIGATTYYFRTEFYFDGDPNEVEQLQISTILDDGAVIYLNGNDVNRIGIDPGPISHTDYSDRSVGDAIREGPFLISTEHLYHGDNVIAVEVHQVTGTSTDIVWGMELRAYGASIGGDVALQPGINRIIVKAFDDHNGTGNELDSEYIDIWYDDGNDLDLFTLPPSNITLKSASGPWHITGDIIVPTGFTLTIEPGTTLFFDAGTGITVQSGGRLVAEGTQYQRIRLTHVPGGSNWDGVKFDNTLEDNRLCYVDHEYGDGQGESTDVQYSRLLIDNTIWGGTNTRILNIDHPSVICRNSVFPSIDTTEPLHGIGLTGNEYLIFDGCIFGTASGYNDIIDFRGAQRPGPILQMYNSIFIGGGDDGVDIDSTDAHIEGNLFMNFHGGGGGGTANAIATGVESGDPTEVYVARNIFMNNDHAVLLKEDCFLYAQNNVFVNSDVAVVSFGEPYRNPPRDPGKGAYIDGCIFWNNEEIFEHFFQEPLPLYGPTGDVNVCNSILPSQWHYLGQNNIDVDPIFVDPNSDFHLKPMSPAIGTGLCGLDMGAYVPAGAAICGEPDEVTYRTEATLTVSGPGITHYKYTVNDPNGPWSAEIQLPANPYDTSDPYYGNDIINLSGLENGQSYTVYVIGKNSAGLWQSEDYPTVSRTWTVDTSYAYLVINEVLAHTQGMAPDLVELYYDGPAPLDLTGMSLTDDPCDPNKFVFSSSTVTDPIMYPGDYMVLYGDPNTSIIDNLGFALSNEGEGLHLYDKPANGGGLIDTIVFGTQIEGFSIGRIGYGGLWKLNKPTFGQVNIFQPLSDPATLKINEWLANEEVLFTNDFIELYNPQVFPVDLGGMYLTDDPVTQPGKHQIGTLSFIAGGGFTVFIADGDTEDGPDHLNFQLSANQEHIALLDAGLKVIDQVLYVPQTTDISQGRVPDGAHSFEFFKLPNPNVTNTLQVIPPATSTLVPSGATAYYYVPTDANWESTWMQSDFNNLAGWQSGPTPLGFGFGGTSIVAYNDCVYRSTDQYIAANVTTYGIGSGYSGPTSGSLVNQAVGDDTGVTATMTQSGGVVWQPEPGSGGSDCAVGTDAYNTFSGIADMTGVIYYGSAGWWIDLTFTGLDPLTQYTFATSSARGNYADRLTIYTLSGSDTYTNASTPGVDVLADNMVRFNTGDNYNEGYVARWTGITAADGSFTVRAEADPGSTDGRKAYSFDVFMFEGGFSGSDLQSEMLGVNASIWSRIEFDVDDPGIFDTLTLRMKYEDGFVAYLNGVEVARDNFTGIPSWNSQADGNRQNELAVQFVDFDISHHIGDLQQGHNVLAIHGLNDDVNDPNFLILPELIAVDYSDINIYGKALALLEGLRITEIMYHAPNSPDYDYIELQNIGDVPLDMNGVRFTDGIDYTFPEMTLDVGGYVVVVSNPASFTDRYGTSGIDIAGEYAGELSNGGEDIVLKLPWPYDAAILRFNYNDAWYPTTDGLGFSLEIIDSTAKAATWDDKESWLAALPTPGQP